MPIERIELLVKGGKAAPDATSGPKLGMLKLDVNKIFQEINEKTKEYEGLEVPVVIEVDTDTKKYEIKVGIPPTSSLIKKEAGIEKAKISEEDKAKGIATIANLKFEQIVKIAKIKKSQLYAKDLKAAVKQIVGTCVSMQGISIEGKDPKEILKEIDEGKWDHLIK